MFKREMGLTTNGKIWLKAENEPTIEVVDPSLKVALR